MLRSVLVIPSAIGIGALLFAGLYSSRLLYRSRGRKRKLTKLLETIEEFRRPTVRMKDPEAVEEKICKLLAGGSQRLQVISDFDATLSRFHHNGKRCSSCHGAIESSSRMPAEYREKVRGYKERYYPIEVDPNLSIEEKTPFMVEWWTNAHNVLLEANLKQSDLKSMVQESAIMLRDDCVSFINCLYQHKVPLVIFSAGIGNILEEVIRQQGCYHDNVKIVSNYMQFGEDDKLVGFRGEVIHAYNKNSSSVDLGDAFHGSEHRTNVMLLGDSLGDVNIDAGLKDVETILRIGFLNDKIEGNLPRYLDNYDVVLLDDQSMDVANAILQKII